jgi:hypothetical protein
LALLLSKGNQVNIPESERGCRVITQAKPGKGRGSLIKSFLFLLTVCTNPGIGLTGDWVEGLAKAVTFGPFWCVPDAP